MDFLADTVSPDRLLRYREPKDTDADVVAKYFWNIQLCEALYPVLQSLEVALRNSIHNTFTKVYATDRWFDINGILERREADMLQNARCRVRERSLPTTTPNIIAALNFGFWEKLFHRPYESKLRFWPQYLNMVFPRLPNKARNRDGISRRICEIVLLRNSVFHHDRIIGKYDIARLHQECYYFLRGISPDYCSYIEKLDRFNEVYRMGRAALQQTFFEESALPML